MLQKFLAAIVLFLVLTVVPIEVFVRNYIINQDFSIYHIPLSTRQQEPTTVSELSPLVVEMFEYIV